MAEPIIFEAEFVIVEQNDCWMPADLMGLTKNLVEAASWQVEEPMAMRTQNIRG